LDLPAITPPKLAEKLTAVGLETNLITKQENIYLEFVILPNRPDL
jgi:hypothetical protein